MPKFSRQSFQEQIGRNTEIYVNDIVIKSSHMLDYVGNLNETLVILRSTTLKLNTVKCTIGVSSRKFLGHIISREGLSINPENVKE